MLSNLLSNAVKFTERGHVKLMVSQVSREEGVASVHFRVVDSGIGIAKENQQAVFEKFQQLMAVPLVSTAVLVWV